MEEDSAGERCFLNLFLFYCRSVMKSVVGKLRGFLALQGANRGEEERPQT